MAKRISKEQLMNMQSHGLRVLSDDKKQDKQIELINEIRESNSALVDALNKLTEAQFSQLIELTKHIKQPEIKSMKVVRNNKGLIDRVEFE